MTHYLRPKDLDEALRARHDHPRHVLLAGGTDLMVLAEKKPHPAGVIDLFRLPELRGIELRDTTVRIGASTTYSELLADRVITEQLPMLAAVAREVGAVQIQNRGTLGGNVGTSSPVGDTLPVLLALEAAIEVVSVKGARRIPYAQFCTGYRRTALGRDELIAAVHVPIPDRRLVQRIRKVGTRRAQAISKTLVAALFGVDGTGCFDHVAIALGAMAATPIRVPAVEAVCRGQAPSSALGDQVRAALAASVTPIDDVRSTADYRLEVVSNLLASWVSAPPGTSPAE